MVMRINSDAIDIREYIAQQLGRRAGIYSVNRRSGGFISCPYWPTNHRARQGIPFEMLRNAIHAPIIIAGHQSCQ